MKMTMMISILFISFLSCKKQIKQDRQHFKYICMKTCLENGHSIDVCNKTLKGCVDLMEQSE